MDFKNCMDNFPWNRFGTVYETNSKELKNKFIKIFDGNAELKDYKYIIERLEHQETLYRITPWGLKFYIYLLNGEKTDKSILLQNIKTLFEAANYNNKCDLVRKYKPTKGNIEKYEKIKFKLFDDEFDGKLNTEYLKIFKAIDRNFMQILIIEYILKKKPLFEVFMNSDDPEIKKSANFLIGSINNPRKFKFINKDGVEEEY
jgi:hypothetical protein